MSDLWFPRTIKPLTNKTYASSRGSNLIQANVEGGLPRISLDTTLESPEFTLNFILSNLAYQAFLSFYDGAINHGSNSFKMMLDSGTGIVEHQCYIRPGSVKVNKPSNGSWVLSLNMIAEVTPSQLDPCPNVYAIYDCYGDQTCQILNDLEQIVREIVYV